MAFPACVPAWSLLGLSIKTTVCRVLTEHKNHSLHSPPHHLSSTGLIYQPPRPSSHPCFISVPQTGRPVFPRQGRGSTDVTANGKVLGPLALLTTGHPPRFQQNLQNPGQHQLAIRTLHTGTKSTSAHRGFLCT